MLIKNLYRKVISKKYLKTNKHGIEFGVFMIYKMINSKIHLGTQKYEAGALFVTCFTIGKVIILTNISNNKKKLLTEYLLTLKNAKTDQQFL